ncbi:MAG: hypothetical protein V4548_14025 [Bacteroidota bacterium]
MKITSLIFLIGLLFTAKPDYDPTGLPQLILKSDVAGECEIQKVTENQIEVKFSDIYHGELKTKSIKVEKFQDWTCASRWTKYKVGQKEIIFIVKNLKSGKWIIIGAGNEGELPIENDIAYYKNPYYGIDKDAKLFELKSGKINGYSFSKSEVREAIKFYYKSYDEFTKMSKDSVKNYKTENNFLKRILFEVQLFKSDNN